MKDYDVLVIGGGPGGYVAAIRAAQCGRKCGLIEKDQLGGVCLNWGCIPTKALLKNAQVAACLCKGDVFGFRLDPKNIHLDYAKAQERSRDVSARLVRGIEYLMRKNAIDVLRDEAVFESPERIRLVVSKKIIEAENTVIATGSGPKRIRGLDCASPRILDSKKALQLKKAPKSVVIVGAGPIGMEFAAIWRAYGAEVTIVEMMPAVLPSEDADISEEAKKAYEKRGIRIYTGASVQKADPKDDWVAVEIQTKAGKETMNAEYVLVSAGIRPNSEALRLEKAGVRTDAGGFIVTDEWMRTNVPHLYAVGDVTGKLALAHAASAQGMVAALHLSGKETQPIDYRLVPKCMYGLPETASAGFTEKQAVEEGYAIVTGKFPFSANGKAVACNEEEGFVKIIADKRYGSILGVHMIGSHVTEMIAGSVGAMSLECTSDEFSAFIHPHPSLSEAVVEAARLINGNAIHM